MIMGGGQENGIRSGTENVASIVGFGKACEIAKERLNRKHFSLSSTSLFNVIERIVKEIPSCKILMVIQKKEFSITFILTFLGVNGEDLIIKLDEHGIAASTGSACSMHTQKASHVLEGNGFQS